MSDFANLRKARHAKEHQKSYISRSKREQDQSVQKDAKPGELPSELLEGFYIAWPASRFEIRISVEDALRGRGVFSREQYRPGKSSL